MNSGLRYSLCVLFCFLCGAVWSQQKNIYIASSGNDAGTGLSVSDPLQNFEEAWKRVAAGDTIFLLPGIHKGGIRLSGKKGVPEKYIYIYGYTKNGDAKPLIDGGATVPAMDLDKNWIEVSNTAWIEIGNLSFVNGWTDPIRVNASSYISFRHCDFKGGRKVILGTGAETHHLLVENCTWDQGGNALWTIDKDTRGVDAWLSMHHELMGYYNGTLIDSRGSGGSFVIRNNTITNAYNGIRFTSKKGYDGNIEVYNNTLSNIRDNDFEPEHYAYNLHIYHNRSHNIHKSFSVDDVAGGYVYYYGNTVTMDGDEWSRKICTGIWKIYGGEDSLSYPLYLFNNSFYVYGKAFNVMEKKALFIKHYNNAYFFEGDGGWSLKYIDPTNGFDYDLSNKPWSASINEKKMEQHGKIANVLYKDPVKRDLRLQSGSPAKDAGKILAFPELEWTQSYKDKSPDIGAYEKNEKVDGPAFRFRKPADAQYSYKERPRIVKWLVDHKKIRVFFSEAIDPATVSPSSVLIYNQGSRIAIAKITFPRNVYEMVIEMNSAVAEEKMSIGFSKLPIGKNGMPVTFWGAAVPIFNLTSNN